MNNRCFLTNLCPLSADLSWKFRCEVNNQYVQGAFTLALFGPLETNLGPLPGIVQFVWSHENAQTSELWST